MNLPTIIVLTVVVILAGLAVYSRIKRRRQGKSCCDSCEGGCPGCNISYNKNP